MLNFKAFLYSIIAVFMCSCTFTVSDKQHARRTVILFNPAPYVSQLLVTTDKEAVYRGENIELSMEFWANDGFMSDSYTVDIKYRITNPYSVTRPLGEKTFYAFRNEDMHESNKMTFTPPKSIDPGEYKIDVDVYIDGKLSRNEFILISIL